ncbi:simple sugar transport system substrate-binding protein [Propionivibrio dicarboxylicus]|uniref:Simple sugar transport system substrate-binding protein n=2 Tax=Propionivibrio dicarboxylicus TaxID=83767 RepID=A0A1G8H090_9RHOO|nr:simple sugar transport system substrate-binding protein [Propionivibrio dicarboxylicus]
MNKAYRLFAVLLASLGLCMLAPQASLAQTGKKLIIGFSQVGAETEWRVAMSKIMKETIAKEKDMELIFSDAQQKQENQLKALRTFILQKVDFIVFAPVVQTGWDSVLQEAKEAKIPVIVINRLVKTSAVKLEDHTVTFIGPDNMDAGRFAANFMIEKFKDAKAPVNVVQLEGTVGASSAVERKAGFEEVIKGQSKLKIVKTQSGDFTRAKGKEVMEAFLKSTKAEGVKIDALFSHSDDMGIGAMQAIEEAGLKPGKDIIIVGIDGVKGAFEAMISGKQAATVENPVDYAKPLIQVIRDYQAKKPIPAWVKLKNTVYPAETAARELPTRLY